MKEVKFVSGVNDVVILNEGTLSTSERYIGPYCIAAGLREAGFSVAVLDYAFRTHIDFESTFWHVADENTKFILISNTFLYDNQSKYNNPYDTYGTAGYKTQNRLGKQGETTDHNQKSGNLSVDQKINMVWPYENKLHSWFRFVKKIAPNAKIIMGGSRTQDVYTIAKALDISEYKIKDYIDLWYVGFADKAIADICSDWDHWIERAENLYGFKFLKMNDNPNKWIKYDIPLNPITARDVPNKDEIIPLEVSRGCAFRCKYCDYLNGYSHKMPFDDIKNQFLYYYENYGCENFFLTTDCFNDNYNFVCGFYEVIKDLPFTPKLSSFARVDLCLKYPDIIDKMIDSGFIGIWVGIESLNHEVAKAAGRGVAPEDIKKVIRQFKDAKPDLLIQGNFIIGLPGETKESQMETFKWLGNQDLIFCHVNVLTIEPYIEDIADMCNYSDYTIDGSKYGLEEVRFWPEPYWKHATMDRNEAFELLKIFKDEYNPNLNLREGTLARAKYMADSLERELLDHTIIQVKRHNHDFIQANSIKM